MTDDNIDDDGDGRNTLPPIANVRLPDSCKTKSARIRYLHNAGYSTSDIAKRIGVIYQHVRNVLKQQPKRAFREEVPVIDENNPLQLLSANEEADLADIALDELLERDLAASAKKRYKKAKATEENGDDGDGE